MTRLLAAFLLATPTLAQAAPGFKVPDVPMAETAIAETGAATT